MPQPWVQQPMPQGRPQPEPQSRVQQPMPQGRPQPTPASMPQNRAQASSQPTPAPRLQPAPAPRPQPAAVPTPPRVPDMVIPRFANPLRKGQKSSLDPQNRGLRTLKACFGWNIIDARCDVDASAFLTAATGKVPGDDWFVFYGQEVSPDNSVKFMEDTSGKDREVITVNLQALNSRIQKVVFVITINEAYENHL
ncbi:MAG: TerD family protein, partial [Blautia sp.]|nr:TerD family protein [Blautia sp.]